MISEIMNDEKIRNKIEEATSYLVRYFDIDMADVLPFDHGRFLSDILQADYREDIFNLILGEEVTHYLDFSSFKEGYGNVLVESSGMPEFVKEVVGHYGGLIYANRNNRSWPFIGLGAEAAGTVGEAYKSADKIFDSYREFRLEEIVKIENLTRRFNKIKELTGELK